MVSKSDCNLQSLLFREFPFRFYILYLQTKFFLVVNVHCTQTKTKIEKK